MSQERKSVQHGRLVVEVPRHWEDESTVRFASPPDDHPERSAFRSTLSISLEPVATAGDSPRRVLERLGEVLRQSGVVCDDVQWTDGKIGDLPAVIVERRVVMMGGARAHELMAAAIVGDEALIVSAAASEKRWEEERAQLESLVAGVRFHG
jgi:hypothetical protein